MDNRITQYLPRLPYWGNLTEAERDAVARHAVIRRYPAGSVLHSGGSACLGMIFVLGGSLRTYLLSEEGREITLFRLAAGDPCVLSAACVVSQLTFDTQMEAETDCDLLIVGAAVFKRLTEENIYVRCFLYELATERFSSVMWTMQQILFEKVDRRLAAFLLSESEKAGSLEVRMTHEEIARQINSAREVVARMLKRFYADGLVELRRGAVRLKNPEALRKI